MFNAPQCLFRGGYTYALRVFFQILCPILQSVTASLMQKCIEESITQKFQWYSYLSVIDYLANTSIFALFTHFSGRTIYFSNSLTATWDDSYKFVVVTGASFILQFWSLFPKFPHSGRIFIPIIHLIYILISDFVSTFLIFISPLLNSIFITGSLFFTVHTILMIVYCTVDNSFFDLLLVDIFVFFIVYLFLSQYIINLLIQRALKKQLLPHMNRLSDFSDDSDSEIELPNIPPYQMILLVRQLVTNGYQDVSEFIMRIIDSDVNIHVLIECIRILVLIGCIPSSVWNRILEIDRKFVSFRDQALLCDLQFESIKNEQSSEIIEPLMRTLDEAKLDVQQYLINFDIALSMKNKKKAHKNLSLYTLASKKYETIARVYLSNSPKSYQIASHYSNFMKELRGNYRESNIWQHRAEALRTGNYSFIPRNSTGLMSTSVLSLTNNDMADKKFNEGAIAQQQLISQQVVAKIHSKYIPAAVLLLIIMNLAILILDFIDPQEFIKYKCSPESYLDLTTDLSMYYYGLIYQVSSILNTALNTEIYITPKDFNMTLWSISNTISQMYPSIPSQHNVQDVWTNRNVSELFTMSAYGFASAVESRIRLINRSYDDPNINIYLTEICSMIEKFNNVLSNINTLIDHYQSDLISILNNYIFIYVCSILIGAIILNFIVYFVSSYGLMKERDMIITVFFKIDSDSLKEFRKKFDAQFNAPLTHHSELMDNDTYSLALDEIELDDNDPISLPIQLPLFLKDDSCSEGLVSHSSDSKSEHPKYDPIFIPSFLIMSWICMIIIGVLFVIYSQRYIQRNTDLSLKRESYHNCFEIVIKIMYSGFHTIAYEYGFLSYKTRVSFTVTPNDIVFFPGIDILVKSFEASNDFYNIEEIYQITFNQSVLVMNQLVGMKEQIINTKAFNEKGVEYLIQFFVVFLTILLFILLLRYMQFAATLFDSLKSILNIMPSKYFSTIATVLDLYNKNFGKHKSKPLEHQSRLIIKHVSLPILSIDSSYKVRSINQALMKVFMLNKDDVMNNYLWKVFPKDQHLDFYNTLNEIIKDIDSEGIEYNFIAYKSDKSPIHINSLLIPFIIGDDNIHVLIIMKEMEDIMKLNEQIKENKLKVKILCGKLMPKQIVPSFQRENNPIKFVCKTCCLIIINIYQFCEWCTNHTHMQILDYIDLFFGKFDKLIDKYPEITKINQRNGSYFAISGLFSNGKDNFTQIALDFVESCDKFVKTKKGLMQTDTQITCGIFYAENITAGVMNHDIPQFDIASNLLSDARDIVKKCPPNHVIFNEQASQMLKENQNVKNFQQMSGMSLFIQPLD